jgi:hypothetical protein
VAWHICGVSVSTGDPDDALIELDAELVENMVSFFHYHWGAEFLKENMGPPTQNDWIVAAWQSDVADVGDSLQVTIMMICGALVHVMQSPDLQFWRSLGYRLSGVLYGSTDALAENYFALLKILVDTLEANPTLMNVWGPPRFLNRAGFLCSAMGEHLKMVFRLHRAVNCLPYEGNLWGGALNVEEEWFQLLIRMVRMLKKTSKKHRRKGLDMVRLPFLRSDIQVMFDDDERMHGEMLRFERATDLLKEVIELVKFW